MHKRLSLFFLLAASGCTGGTVVPWFTDGGFTVDGGYLASSAQVVDGTYTWQQVEAPTFGGAIYGIHVVTASDVWFFGRDARHWNGTALQHFALTSSIVVGRPDLGHYAQTWAYLSATDIWAGGSALWHFDGTAWVDKSDAVPTVSPGYPRTFKIVHEAGVVYVNVFQQGLPTSYALVAGAFVPGPAPEKRHQTSGWVWSRAGDTFYSFSIGANNELQFTEAPANTAFTVKASLAQETLPWATPALQQAYIGPPFQPNFVGGRRLLTVQAISKGANSVHYMAHTVDAKGGFSFLINVEGATATVLPDRLYGWRVYSMADVGPDLWVAGSGGSLWKGAHQ